MISRWGETVDGEKCYDLHEGQSDIITANARFKAAIAGTGGGKTVLGALWCAQQIKRCSMERDISRLPILGMIVAPTYQIMARATAPTFVLTLRDTDLEGRYVESKNRYYLPNDWGTVWMLSADNPHGLQGGQVDFVWIDEGGQLVYNAWLALQARTGQKRAPILITTTPYWTNWLDTKFNVRAKEGDPDYFVRQWPSISNPAYPKEEYDRAKGTMSPERAAMLYDGKFARMTGLVYPMFDRCKVDPFKEIPDGRHCGGMDWGWNNPFAAISGVSYINEFGDDILYVYYERYKRFTPLGEHARAIPENTMWWADPSEPDSIFEMRRAGHKVRKGLNTIRLGIDAVSTRIYSGRLLISSECKALFGEAGLYRYPERDDDVYGDKPIDENNHALDSLRYLIMGIDKRRVAA